MTDAAMPEPIHECVARHAARHPESTALRHRGRAISYGTLDAAADVYAAELAGRGVGPGAVVPVLLPRSPQLVALQLALLKRGAAYAGIDGRWPRDRKSAIIEQIVPALVVTPEEFPPEEPRTVAERRTGAGGAAVVPVEGSAPATVFFTSGTTGGPKGVVSPHRAVSRLFHPGGLPGFGPGHATPQAAPLPWDMYAFELWGQLCAGGTSVLVDGDHLLPGTLRALVRADGVDTLWLTTSLFNLFVDEDPDCFAGLRQVFIGGEKLSPGHVRRFLREHPRIPLHNGYGPAENCMLTTTRRIGPEDCDLPGGIPVGEPVRGTAVLVLDPEDAPRAPGEVGEIHIAGSGLATGYLARPEETARRFVTVWVDGAPRRVYRTGDLGFFDIDGCLHFRGRADRQVKISGYRVEPGEIEAATRRLPGVRDCVVLPVADADGQVSRLMLWYLTEKAGDGAGDPLDVRGHLSRTLPDYLVPATIGALERFPVTANGKRDTAALLRLGRRARRSTRARRTSPETPLLADGSVE